MTTQTRGDGTGLCLVLQHLLSPTSIEDGDRSRDAHACSSHSMIQAKLTQLVEQNLSCS